MNEQNKETKFFFTQHISCLVKKDTELFNKKRSNKHTLKKKKSSGIFFRNYLNIIFVLSKIL